MLKTDFKKRIIVSSTCFVLFSFGLFGYLFPWFQRSNASLGERVLAERKEVLLLEAEQRNFEQGKRDLDALAQKTIQPADFFSSDTSLVQEIRTLEALTKSLGINLSLAVAGTIDKAPKAKAATEIRIIPLTMQVTGEYGSLVQFLENLEHLPFITSIHSVTVVPQEDNEVLLTLVGNFYVKNST